VRKGVRKKFLQARNNPAKRQKPLILLGLLLLYMQTAGSDDKKFLNFFRAGPATQDGRAPRIHETEALKMTPRFEQQV